jgi:pimeloyl-ACP methyl ester carboxylesterase
MDTTQSIYKSPAGQQAIMALYNSVLERWPVAYETVDIPTQHGHTFVIVCGEPAAPPLILLHGAGTNSTMWVGDVVAYAPHYRVYAVDLLGEPGQSAPNRPAWAGPAYAEWLGDVVTALKIDKVTLVGISQGAWTAVKYAVYKPERVEKLVLLTPGGITPDKMSFLIRVVPLLLLGRWGIQRVNRILFADQPIPDEVEDVMTLIFTHFKPRLGVLPLFSDEELKRLTMPVLLLIGAKDALRDAKKIEARMAGLLPDLTAMIIPGAGHALLNTTVQIMPFLTTGNDV